MPPYDQFQCTISQIIHCLSPVWNCLNSCKRKGCKMQNSRNSLTLINIGHLLHLKATAALRIVGNISHFFLKIFSCILYSAIFLSNFGRKLISLLQTPIFWRQEMTSDYPLIQTATLSGEKALFCNIPILPCFEEHNRCLNQKLVENISGQKYAYI